MVSREADPPAPVGAGRRDDAGRVAVAADETMPAERGGGRGTMPAELTVPADETGRAEKRARARRPSFANAWMSVLAAIAGIFTLALLAATRPSVSDGRGVAASTKAGSRAARGGASRQAASRAGASGPASSGPAAGSHPAAASANAATPGPPITTGPAGATCVFLASPAGYSNPLAACDGQARADRSGSRLRRDRARWLRSDPGTITYLATSDTGWPGAFIEYRLTGGADAGCYVYYAEGVNPSPGLRVGQSIVAGQPIATIIPQWPTGIEIGWGAGTGTKAYAGERGEWSDSTTQENIPTPEGKSFSALIAALGGPPGKLEGQYLSVVTGGPSVHRRLTGLSARPCR